ncbi:hypothetical protein ACOMHN_000114 [Nucella lapillus]
MWAVAGFSDPYCMLGIMPGNSSSSQDNDSGVVYSSDEDSSPGCSPKTSKDQDRRHGGSSKRFSLHKKKERGAHGVAVRDHLPARLIRTTVVRPNTLNPVWKEKFRL